MEMHLLKSVSLMLNAMMLVIGNRYNKSIKSDSAVYAGVKFLMDKIKNQIGMVEAKAAYLSSCLPVMCPNYPN
jgi:hypothetical protein